MGNRGAYVACFIMYKTAFGLGSQSVFSAFCLVLRGGAGDRGGQGQPGVE